MTDLQQRAADALEERRKRGEKAKKGRREKARERSRELARNALIGCLQLDEENPPRLRVLNGKLLYPTYMYDQDELRFLVAPESKVRGAPEHYNVFLRRDDDEDVVPIERLADLGEALAG